MVEKILEVVELSWGMADRLRHAAERIKKTLGMERLELSVYTLRQEQVGVYEDVASYFADVSSADSSVAPKPPMARIILPPRTGKTVVAGHVIAGAALTTIFIVPTKTLVEQTRRELSAQLPGIPIGVYYGECKELVSYGVNITTYQILQAALRMHDVLPWPVRHSALIFADEGHRAMTARRMQMLRDGFDPLAVRIALTATPDYDEERALGRYFLHLIHEITIAEAVGLDLLAPVRVWVAEVDVDASQVRVIAGELEDEALGRVMSAAPFFRAVEVYRWSGDNASRSALICCASRQQAYDLAVYLAKNRPAGTPSPELILAETSREERRRILADFESGRVDTIINVGVLVEGWNSPRCKLLVDLSPSVSRVRATQKFFRPMTKWGDTEARIIMLMPKNLPRLPLMPMDVFGWSSEVYEPGTLIASRRLQRKEWRSRPVAPIGGTPGIEGVELKSRIVVQSVFEKPELDPRNNDEIRRVLESNENLQPSTASLRSFRWLFFRHELFTGRGEQLLRYLGVALRKEAYEAWLLRLYPEVAADRMLRRAGASEEIDEGSCYEDATYLAEKLVETLSIGGRKVSFHRGFWLGWRALGGPFVRDPEEQPETPEEALIRAQREQEVQSAIEGLSPRLQEVLRQRFGIGQPDQTYEEIAVSLGVSRERVRQIEAETLRKLRQSACSNRFKSYYEND